MAVMDGAGKSGGLGRGNQDANTEGNAKITSPLTTSTGDARDRKPNLHQNLAATNEVGSLPASRGGHNRAIMGG